MRRLAPFLVLVCALSAAAAPAGASEPASAGRYDDTVIVKYREGVTPPERRPLLGRAGAEETVEGIGALEAKVVEVDQEEDPAEVADRLEDSRKVAYAEPNFVMRTQGRRPDDARFSSLWALRNSGQTGGTRGADVNALKGWARVGVGSFPRRGGVRVGIVDTGIDEEHSDLNGKVAACREIIAPTAPQVGPCDDDFMHHGTHVAGTIGAIADNGAGVSGVAFNSQLVVCRALGGPDEKGRVSDIARCITWAKRKGADVISMSFAGAARSRTLHRAVKRTWKDGRRRGAVLVGAAGNGGWRQAMYPAAFPEVISVAATTDRDRRAWFSNIHRTVEVAAPGQGILSTARDDGYRRESGTSMAVPHVSGIAAQLRGDHPRWGAKRVRRIIGRTADDLGPKGRDSRFGLGRVDFGRAARR